MGKRDRWSYSPTSWKFGAKTGARQQKPGTRLFRAAGGGFGRLGRLATRLASGEGQDLEQLSTRLQRSAATLTGQLGQQGIKSSFRLLRIIIRKLLALVAKIIATLIASLGPWILALIVLIILVASTLSSVQRGWDWLFGPRGQEMHQLRGEVFIDTEQKAPKGHQYGLYQECTWWVYNALYFLGYDVPGPSLGNGGEWAWNAAARGYPISREAAVGRAGCFNSVSADGWDISAGLQGTSRYYGHIVICTAVYPDGSAKIFEGWARRTVEEDGFSREAHCRYQILSPDLVKRLYWIDFARDFNPERAGSASPEPKLARSHYENNERYIWDYLRNRGFTPEAASGVMGHMMMESGLEPGMVERAPVSADLVGYGLCQWTASRRTALEEFARERAKPVSDLDTQLAFIFHELEVSSTAYYERLGLQLAQYKKLLDVDEAVTTWGPYEYGRKVSAAYAEANYYLSKRLRFAWEIYRRQSPKRSQFEVPPET